MEESSIVVDSVLEDAIEAQPLRVTHLQLRAASEDDFSWTPCGIKAESEYCRRAMLDAKNDCDIELSSSDNEPPYTRRRAEPHSPAAAALGTPHEPICLSD